jgi:hypothetical protein
VYSSILESSQEHIYIVVVSWTIWGVEDSIYRRPATEDIIAVDTLARRRLEMLDLLCAGCWQRAQLWQACFDIDHCQLSW